MVVEKNIPIEIILRDAAVSELCILDKLERQATHGLLRAVAFQLERLIPQGLARCWTPATWNLWPLTNSAEKRYRLPSGSIVIANKDTKQCRPVLPLGFNLKTVLICNHVLDRGSTGMALVHFAQYIGLLWTWTWGFCHDTCHDT